MPLLRQPRAGRSLQTECLWCPPLTSCQLRSPEPPLSTRQQSPSADFSPCPSLEYFWIQEGKKVLKPEKKSSSVTVTCQCLCINSSLPQAPVTSGQLLSPVQRPSAPRPAHSGLAGHPKLSFHASTIIATTRPRRRCRRTQPRVRTSPQPPCPRPKP